MNTTYLNGASIFGLDQSAFWSSLENRKLYEKNGKLYDITDDIVNSLERLGVITRKQFAYNQIRTLCFCYGSMLNQINELAEYLISQSLNSKYELEEFNIYHLFLLQTIRRCIKLTEIYIVSFSTGNYQSIHTLSRSAIDCLAITSSFLHVLDSRDHILSFLSSSDISKCDATALPKTKKGKYQKFNISMLLEEYDPINKSMESWMLDHYRTTCKFTHHTPTGIFDFVKIDLFTSSIQISLDEEFTSLPRDVLHIDRYIEIIKECCLLVEKLSGRGYYDVFNSSPIGPYRNGMIRLKNIYHYNFVPKLGKCIRVRNINKNIHDVVILRNGFLGKLILPVVY